MPNENLFLTDAQLRSEIARCEFCEEKPCKTACPADCSPADFIMAAKTGRKSDIERAAAQIMSRNPLGGICGAVCPETHCQSACVHMEFDRPVEIPSVQAALVARAKKDHRLPKLQRDPASGKKVAVVGAGPAGLAAAFALNQLGHEVTILEKEARPGGACALIPPHRLDPEVYESDIEFVLSHPGMNLKCDQPVDNPESLLQQGFDGVVVAVGRQKPYELGIPGESLSVDWMTYLKDVPAHPASGRVAIIGGGAVACDCAVAARLAGASQVDMLCLEEHFELAMTAKEKRLLDQHKVSISPRTSVKKLASSGGGLSLTVTSVALPAGERFHPARMVEVSGSTRTMVGYDKVIVAIGSGVSFPETSRPEIVLAGDVRIGASTVVEAVGSGKNAAEELHSILKKQTPKIAQKQNKGTLVMPGHSPIPVGLSVDFFGRTIPSPFLLSAAPPSDGYDQMKKALDAGWAGGIMKTAFDGIPIHIPSEYMQLFNEDTYGNCDNVSGHALDRVCGEIGRLIEEYPDRLIGASTGGPLTGNDLTDKLGWQKNSRKLEAAGAMAVEFSLSCPQGGDGTEGDIVSQSAALTAKIVDWVMETSDPEIPKLFKLTGAVTSIVVILRAIAEVFERYPNKKAGVTLANTFPVLDFRERSSGKWDEGILFGMSGAGVAPISNLTLANAASVGLTVSGNGGPMDYLSAAHFLALGARTVQFCTVATKYGVGIIDELHSGLSHLMRDRGMKSVEDLIGAALPHPITDFMALTPVKKVSESDHEMCMKCGNCTRCPYLAISLSDEGYPVTDPSRCVGCGICAAKCFSGAIHLRPRTEHELSVLREH